MMFVNEMSKNMRTDYSETARLVGLGLRQSLFNFGMKVELSFLF